MNLLLENQNRKKQSLDNGRSLENIDTHGRSASQDETGSPKWSPMHHSKSQTVSESTTPVNVDLSPVDERAGPPLSNMQTYREYKEALKQQRNQDTTAVYRSKDNTSASGSSSGGSNQASPMSPVNGNKSVADVITIKPKMILSKEGGEKEDDNSRNNNNTNNGSVEASTGCGGDEGGYVKPASPMAVTKTATNGVKTGDSTDSIIIKSIMNGNTKSAERAANNINKTGGGVGTVNGGAKSAANTTKRTVSWNRDVVTPEKNISFTMRREFDRHKEEAELTGKLRNVCESAW